MVRRPGKLHRALMTPNWNTLLESPLRGFKETPLRALQTTEIKRNKLYAIINVMSRNGGELGLGDFLSNGVEDLRVWTLYYYNVPRDYYNSVVVNSSWPIQLTPGQIIDVGDPQFEAVEKANWWFSQFMADLIDWHPGKAPITEWTLSPPDTDLDNPPKFVTGNMAINGFSVWPEMVSDMVRYLPPAPGASFTTYKCISRARRGASITLCKKDITGIVTLHDPVARPVESWTNCVLSPCQRLGSRLVNITADAATSSIYEPDNEFIFDCPPDKVLCFWLGKTFEELPNSGPPHFTPIEFNPWDYGLLSSYAPINPPYL